MSNKTTFQFLTLAKSFDRLLTDPNPSASITQFFSRITHIDRLDGVDKSFVRLTFSYDEPLSSLDIQTIFHSGFRMGCIDTRLDIFENI